MCGILGAAGPQGRRIVEQLIGTLRLRGPDDEGIWFSPELSIGHRRLAIIGTDSGGRQPMVSRSGDSVLAFNGEIYNYLEIADQLASVGIQCDRRYDTSVLLESLEAWGPAVLPKLNGMFSLAWYRPRENRVLLCRDRWGKKPLFWGTFPSEGRRYLAFSSDLRTFARIPGGTPSTDPLGVARYLVYDGMPGRRTVFAGVSKVPAACWIDFETNGAIERQHRYWTFEHEGLSPEVETAKLELTDRLLRSTELRLRSDVPVGLFLSGGIDSSLLAAFWRRLRPNDSIKTFTIGFEDSSFDERAAARCMARRIDSEHHELVLAGQELEAGLDRVFQNLTEPFADPSLVPTSLLCRFAADHVRVALGGDGADELQAGYDPFRAWKLAKGMTGFSSGLFWGSILGMLERLVPANDGNLSLKFKLHHFSRGLRHPNDERIQAWMASFSVELALMAMNPDLAEEVSIEEILEPSREAFRAFESVGDLHAQINTWCQTYLESSILTKVDRAGMASSLEVRSPFLDPSVAEYLFNLNPGLVFRRGRGKILLRQVANDNLPKELLGRPKKGLGVPLGTWFRTVLRERVEEHLGGNPQQDWFNREVIQDVWAEHSRGHYDHRKALWSFLIGCEFLENLGN